MQSIKILNQRLMDLKKTLQEEIRGHQSVDLIPSEATMAVVKSSTDAVLMDEISFKYLKNVLFKFLTSREVEARHLLRAVSTLLRLTNEEEKILNDTLSWKVGWFFGS